MRFEGSIDHAQQAAEGYLVIFRGAQMTLDAISAGDSARVQELLAGYPGGRSEGGSSGSRLKDTLHFRQMPACMVLGLLLHHGYLLQLPASALFDILENRTLDIDKAKTMDDIHDAVLSAALGLCELVQNRSVLHSNSLLRRANEYIESHLTTPFSEKDVADAAGVSVGYLNTLSKGEVGCTLHRYILEKRLGLAQSLLSSSELSITAIAAELCFSSSSHFGQSFSSIPGLPLSSSGEKAGALPCFLTSTCPDSLLSKKAAAGVVLRRLLFFFYAYL